MTLFNLANTAVDRSVVNPNLIARMADSAKNIKAKGNPDADSWAQLADRVTKNDNVSKSDLDQLSGLGKSCFTYHKKLHSDFKASGYKDKAIAAEIADVHVFSAGNDAIKEALAVGQAKVAIAAVAGASFGPTGVLAAYAASAKLDPGELKGLVDELQGIRDGNSHTQFAGNQVKAFHREEIWPEMMQMLDGAIASGKAGKPQEVNAQYYELTNQQVVGKLAQAAEAGNKLRVNVDAGRLVAFKGSHVEIDEVPDKLRSLIQLASVKGDVGVSAYPVPKELGDPGNLMHRKGLRVGDSFLLSGMNANEGSGENVDAGYLIQGPAARKLVQNFARDVAASAGASNEDVFGAEPLSKFMAGDINMGTRGLIGMFDCAAGPSPAGTSLPHASSYAELNAQAEKNGQKIADYCDLTPAQIDEKLAAGEQLPLSTAGKEKFLALVERALGGARSQENVAHLKDVTAPEGKVAGATQVTIADLPVEREAVMLTAIQNADKFVYIPAFVMTRTVASMLVARRDELKAEGKDLDVRVICDPGVYPDGGTPNEYGVKYLENAGIPVRWADLPRSGWHDRKIHAKEILTDKGEVYGSTNFSNKGLRENWEHSGYTTFDESDTNSIAQRDHAKDQFLKLWDRESFDLNSLEKGKQLRERAKDDKDFLQQADEARFNVLRNTIHGIEAAEKDTGAFVAEQAKTVADQVAALEKQGYDEGSAALLAVEKKLGTEGFYSALDQLPARQALEKLK